MCHVYFTTEPCKALSAPVTEITLLTMKEGITRENFVPLLATLVVSVGAVHGTVGGAAWGPVVENARQYALVVGWKDMEVSDCACPESSDVPFAEHARLGTRNCSQTTASKGARRQATRQS